MEVPKVHAPNDLPLEESSIAPLLIKLSADLKSIGRLSSKALWNFLVDSPPFPKTTSGFYRVELSFEHSPLTQHSATTKTNNRPRIIFKNSTFWQNIDEFKAQKGFSLRNARRRETDALLVSSFSFVRISTGESEGIVREIYSLRAACETASSQAEGVVYIVQRNTEAY